MSASQWPKAKSHKQLKMAENPYYTEVSDTIGLYHDICADAEISPETFVGQRDEILQGFEESLDDLMDYMQLRLPHFREVAQALDTIDGVEGEIREITKQRVSRKQAIHFLEQKLGPIITAYDAEQDRAWLSYHRNWRTFRGLQSVLEDMKRQYVRSDKTNELLLSVFGGGYDSDSS